ncbi:DNA repair exonuclease [Paraburkholderia madseniana]|uniref:DNA repair exonuclease n=1 Tax=Paraburkholderia madseniana TaxID=2599607 RepID=A0A6N6W713_9BURK|nr:DNA repair exonuclease [Paraburkholderia madseniana]KAE8755648.1 DNA repair exonuclease [Paraburkholderia madseniana]
MKFIHAADIHLDSPLHGLSAYPDAPTAQLRSASREALSRLVDRAIEEEVAFLIIAGDLYDGDWRDHNTGIFFGQQMGRLRKAGIRVFLLYGNHDAENEMTKKLTLPDNVIPFSSRKPDLHKLDDLKVALHGQSFRDKAVVENLALGYRDPVQGYYNIGVLHTALEGYSAHANYAPCSRAELQAKGYDYWALGHVHEFQLWSEQSTIVFPGNLQGRHIREAGRRGAVLVTVENGHTIVDRLFLDVLRWESVQVEAADCISMEDVARKVGVTLENLLSSDGHVPRAVRVTLTGQSPVHGVLFGKAKELRAEVLNQIAVIGNEKLWLEKIKVATSPTLQSSDYHARMDAIADLQEILKEAANDPEFLALLNGDLQPFFGKVNSEVKEDVPLLALARSGNLSELVRHVSPALLMRLAEGD